METVGWERESSHRERREREGGRIHTAVLLLLTLKRQSSGLTDCSAKQQVEDALEMRNGLASHEDRKEEDGILREKGEQRSANSVPNSSVPRARVSLRP